MSKVHFDARGRGVYFPGFTECGADNPYTTKDLLKTKNPKEVTCMRCMRTKAYREALEKETHHA